MLAQSLRHLLAFDDHMLNVLNSFVRIKGHVAGIDQAQALLIDTQYEALTKVLQ